MKFSRLFLASCAVMMLSPAALAADASDVTDLVIEAPETTISESAGSNYIALRLGAAFADETTIGLDATGLTPTDIITDYKTGWAGGIAIGHDYGALAGLGMRAEVEFGYTRNEVGSDFITDLGATLSEDITFGTTTVAYGLVNGALDYAVGSFRPYVTGGIGYAYGSFNNQGATVDATISAATGVPVGDLTAMDDSDWGFAWQVGAGVGYAVNDQMSLEFGYRYFGTENLDVVATDGTASTVDFRQHQALFGVRYSF